MPTSSTPVADRSADIQEYAPLSAAAVTGFLLALLTPAGLLAPSLAIFGGLPVVLGFIGVARIRRSAVPMKGRSLALAAIAISLFFMAASFAGHTLSRQHLSREAQARFLEWTEYVKAGNLYEAHELHRQYTDRQLPGADLAAIYTLEKKVDATESEVEEMMQVMKAIEFSPKEELEIFFGTPPLPMVVANVGEATFDFLRLEDIRVDGPDTEISMKYRMKYRRGGAIGQLDFIVRMMRSRYEGGEYHWSIFDVKQVVGED